MVDFSAAGAEAEGEAELQQLQPQPTASPEQTKADAAKWTLVSRLSSRLSAAQGARTAQQGSASGQSTPSNLERAVLLLEAEGDSLNGDSKASAVSSPGKLAGESSEHEASEAAASDAAELADRQAGSSTAKKDSMQQEASEEPGPSRKTLNEETESTDLNAQRSALRKVNTGDGRGPSESGRDSLDEGPSTPPANSAAARADTKASSSPNSTAGRHLQALPTLYTGALHSGRIATVQKLRSRAP